MWDTLWIGGAIATLDPARPAPYGLIEHGALAVEDGRIAWIGEVADLPGMAQSLANGIEPFGNALMTPGLIDCHTHLIYGGERADEFEARLNGASYEDIAHDGGGIASTVRATRAASIDELVDLALPRLDALIAEGATCIEIKSGYGLDVEDELKMLRAARRLESERPVRILTTFLGAHALPPEYENRADDYIDHVCNDMLPAARAQGLVDAVDGFCETVAFTPAQIERVFVKATTLGLPVKLHAEQLSNQGGARLAARFGALSADHLEYLDESDICALVYAQTTAVLLPGAYYFLRETKTPPVEALRAAGADMALATDCNPGTSPMTSLLMAMNMGCTLFGLTPEEALVGVTRNAANALGLDDAGVLTVGKRADLAVWNVRRPSALAYYIGYNPLQRRIFAGCA